jgi:hypothetical protein
VSRAIAAKFILVFIFFSGCTSQEEAFSLTPQNIDMWKNYITPTQSELAWTRIPWLSSFGEGMIQADAQKKPVLLWVMNGHPLGCT